MKPSMLFSPLLTLLLLLLQLSLPLQLRCQVLIGMQGGFSQITPTRFVTLDGGGSYSGDGASFAGALISIKTGRNLWFESGVLISRHHLISTPEFMPGIDMTPEKNVLTLVSVPLKLNLELGRYFFLNGGLLIDLETDRTGSYFDNQSGMGFELGTGINYQYRNLYFRLNPLLRMHAFPAFQRENYQQHLLEAGVGAGIGVILGKKLTDNQAATTR